MQAERYTHTHECAQLTECSHGRGLTLTHSLSLPLHLSPQPSLSRTRSLLLSISCRQVVKRVRERDLRFKERGSGTKRKQGQLNDSKARSEFVKRRRQIGYDADAKLGLSAL